MSLRTNNNIGTTSDNSSKNIVVGNVGSIISVLHVELVEVLCALL
jgi:hypothetical protein